MPPNFAFIHSSCTTAAAALLVVSIGAGCGDGGNGSSDAATDTSNANDGNTRDRELIQDSSPKDHHVGKDAPATDGTADTSSPADGGDATPPGDASDAGKTGDASDAGKTMDGATDAADSSRADASDSAPRDGSMAGDARDSSGPPPTPVVNLGMAGDFVILAETGISTVPTSAVTGDMGVSPAAATYITGFSLTADSTNVFSTSAEVTGKVYAADYAVPTPSNLTTAIGDMKTAFTDAAGRPASVLNLGAGSIGGMTLAPAVYKWGTGLLIPTDVTLNGNATDVWIFQIASTLTMSNATKVTLTGGALAKNVFWQVSGDVSLGTTSHFEGIILGQTGIVLGTGASINGRMLAQTAVSIDSSAVVQPAP